MLIWRLSNLQYLVILDANYVFRDYSFISKKGKESCIFVNMRKVTAAKKRSFQTGINEYTSSAFRNGL